MAGGESIDVEERVREQIEEKIERPREFRVLMHNDDYTTQEFVVMVLMTIFQKAPREAVDLMLTVHFKGVAKAGVFSKQVAETKIAAVHFRAREQGYPLRCTMEPE